MIYICIFSNHIIIIIVIGAAGLSRLARKKRLHTGIASRAILRRLKYRWRVRVQRVAEQTKCYGSSRWALLSQKNRWARAASAVTEYFLLAAAKPNFPLRTTPACAPMLPKICCRYQLVEIKLYILPAVVNTYTSVLNPCTLRADPEGRLYNFQEAGKNLCILQLEHVLIHSMQDSSLQWRCHIKPIICTPYPGVY